MRLACEWSCQGNMDAMFLLTKNSFLLNGLSPEKSLRPKVNSIEFVPPLLIENSK